MLLYQPSYVVSDTNNLRFMALSNAEITYFITQVGMSAASFGVADSDVTAVGTALKTLFGYRCAPPTTVVPSQGAQLQSICVAESCPVSPNATCDSYDAVVEPKMANATAGGNSTSGGGSGSGGSATSGAGGASPSSTGTPPQQSTNSAAIAGLSFAAIAGGFAALLL